MPREELTHKIYLATFDRPRYVMEIGEMIYGVKKDTYPKLMGKNGAINKCLNKGWIKDVTKTTKPPKDKPIGFDKRRYYRADIDIILKRIKENTRIIINDYYVLENILTSNSFRYLIGKEVKKNMKDFSGIDAIEFILGYIDNLFVISGLTIAQNKNLDKQFQQLKSIKQYKKVIYEIKKNKGLTEELKKITEKFFEEKNLPDNVIEDFVYLFVIPGRLSWGHEGFSEIGKRYYKMIEVFQGIVKLFEN